MTLDDILNDPQEEIIQRLMVSGLTETEAIMLLSRYLEDNAETYLDGVAGVELCDFLHSIGSKITAEDLYDAYVENHSNKEKDEDEDE